MNKLYDREDELKRRLNDFLSGQFSLEEKDYYSNLDESGFLKLKAVLSDINNIITMKVTLSFVHWLAQNLDMAKSDVSSMIEKIKGMKPNTNGYDIELDDPIELIAEVKCNVPIKEGTVYGSAQKNGIIKDMDALIDGKSKSRMDPQRCLKFMVFLDTPEIRKATEHLFNNLNHPSTIVEASDVVRFDSNKIYTVFLGFEA